MVRVAIVTGANKGIGRCVVRSLCKQFNGDVILTSRDTAKGSAAVKLLQREGLKPRCLQLDIEDPQSIDTFRRTISCEYGGIDILVNNAGIMFRSKDPTPLHGQVRRSLAVNFYATLAACDRLFPLMAENSRVVNVSSSLGQHALKLFTSDIRQELTSESLTNQRLLEIIDQYERSCTDPRYQQHSCPSWLNIPYAVSKLALTVLTRIQARDAQDAGRKVLINACCPGFTQTDMTTGGTLVGKMYVRKNPYAKSPWEAARIPVHLALLASDATKPNGSFVTEIA